MNSTRDLNGQTIGNHQSVKGKLFDFKNVHVILSIKNSSGNYHIKTGVGKLKPMDNVMVEGVPTASGNLEISDAYEQPILLYNEFIVYNADQIKIKYLVRLFIMDTIDY